MGTLAHGFHSTSLCFSYFTWYLEPDWVNNENCPPPEFTKLVLMSPDKIFSWMKWQSISICLVLSRNTELEAMWKATWLSQIRVIDKISTNLRSLSSCFSHTSSQNLATTVCFLFFQETKLPPTKIQYPEVDLLSVGEPAYSAFEYPTTVRISWSSINRWNKCLQLVKNINFRVSHILREGNVCADKIASLCLIVQNFFWWGYNTK